MVWYSHLFSERDFPQFIVIHTVKGFGIFNKAEVDVFLELSCLFNDPVDVGNLISGSPAFSKSSLNIWKLMIHILLEISGEITSERMKGWSQSKNNTQLWIEAVIEARSNAVKSNVA